MPYQDCCSNRDFLTLFAVGHSRSCQGIFNYDRVQIESSRLMCSFQLLRAIEAHSDVKFNFQEHALGGVCFDHFPSSQALF